MAGRVWMKGGANAAWITEAVTPTGPGQEARSRGAKSPLRCAERRRAWRYQARAKRIQATPLASACLRAAWMDTVALLGAPLPHACEGNGIRAHPAPAK